MSTTNERDPKLAAKTSAAVAAENTKPEDQTAIVDPEALKKAARKNHGIAASLIKRPKDKGGDIQAGAEVALDDFDEADRQALIDSRSVVVQGVNDAV
jgi:hypothetical protein